MIWRKLWDFFWVGFCVSVVGGFCLFMIVLGYIVVIFFSVGFWVKSFFEILFNFYFNFMGYEDCFYF